MFYSPLFLFSSHRGYTVVCYDPCFLLIFSYFLSEKRCRGKKCAMQTCILSKFSRQFTSSREAVGATEVFPEEEEESPVEYVSSDDDSSEEDEEECAEQETYFPGLGADERPASPMREAIAIHPGDPTHREEAPFPVLHPSVDQTESTHRTDIVDATD
jgi:hypothetical protein